MEDESVFLTCSLDISQESDALLAVVWLAGLGVVLAGLYLKVGLAVSLLLALPIWAISVALSVRIRGYRVADLVVLWIQMARRVLEGHPPYAGRITTDGGEIQMF